MYLLHNNLFLEEGYRVWNIKTHTLMHTHTHTHTHAHTHTHTHMASCIHMHVHTHTHTHMYICTYAHRPCLRAHAHAHTHTHTHIQLASGIIEKKIFVFSPTTSILVNLKQRRVQGLSYHWGVQLCHCWEEEKNYLPWCFWKFAVDLWIVISSADELLN